MALVLILGGGFGWVAYNARVQRDAVAAIVRSGGSVLYDWEVSTAPDANVHTTSSSLPIPNGRPWWPKWLVSLLGPDYFGSVRSAQLGPRDPDDVMSHVSRLGRLESLGLASVHTMTDAGMAHLKGLTRLKELYLTAGAGVTGEGLKNLGALNRLQILHLRNPSGTLTGADLRPLQGMSDLRYLLLMGPNIGDEGMAQLADSVKLRRLVVYRTPITSEGLGSLRGMTRLYQVSVDRTRITDLEPLSHLTGLTELIITDTPVDDAGLMRLGAAKGLKRLVVMGTQVTDTGVAEIKKKNPKLAVFHK
jgi:hypothetical protein